MSNFQEWCRTILLAVAAVAPAILVYLLTTQKDENALNKVKKRGQEAPGVYLEELERLQKLAVEVDGRETPDLVRELSSALKALSDFGEYSGADVYTHSGPKGFMRFGHLRRIGYHFRDEMARLHTEYEAKGEDGQLIDLLVKIKKLAAEIRYRLEVFKPLHQESPSPSLLFPENEGHSSTNK